jgi:hypothetical protein
MSDREEFYDEIVNKYLKKFQTYTQKKKIINDIALEFELAGMPLPKISSEIKKRLQEHYKELEISERWIEMALDKKYKEPRKNYKELQTEVPSVASDTELEDNKEIELDTSGNVIEKEPETKEEYKKAYNETYHDLEFVRRQLDEEKKAREAAEQKLDEVKPTTIKVEQQEVPKPESLVTDLNEKRQIEVQITLGNLAQMNKEYMKWREKNKTNPDELRRMMNSAIFFLDYDIPSNNVLGFSIGWDTPAEEKEKLAKKEKASKS